MIEMPELAGTNLLAEGEERSLTSYSFWNTFRNCRRRAYWRYVEGLKSVDRAPALVQGDLVHRALAAIYETGGTAYAFVDVLDEFFTDAAGDAGMQQYGHIALAMMEAYVDHYPREEFEVIAIEKPFVGEITNPFTGAKSRSFLMGGKVDGLVRTSDGLFILEHKTCSRIDGAYLDRLWSDMQVQFYSLYVTWEGEKVIGTIYNMLEKPRLEMKGGETDAEFEERKLGMKQPGRAKQQMAETDEEYQDRLRAWYAAEPRFHREVIYFTPEDLDEQRMLIWELSQQYLQAARQGKGSFYQNTSQCFNYNRACEFLPLCQSHGSEAVKCAFYVNEKADPADTNTAAEELAF